MFAPNFKFHTHLINFQRQFCPENSLISTLVCGYLCASNLAIQESGPKAGLSDKTVEAGNKLYQAKSVPWELQDNVNFTQQISQEQDKEKTNSGSFGPLKTQGPDIGPAVCL